MSYSYDPKTGHLLSRTQPEGVVTYGYDPQLTYLNSIAGPGPVTVNLTKGGPLVLSEQYVNIAGTGHSSAARWSYDNRFQISTSGIDGGASFNYAYDNDEVLTQAGDLSLSRGTNGFFAYEALGGLSSSFSYDSYGAVSGLSTASAGSSVYGLSLTRDVLSRVSTRAESIGSGAPETTSYQYDSSGRLSTVVNGATTTSYSYDANGNRLNNGAIYDAQDRLTADNIYTYVYDARGALRQKVNKLTAVISNYTYDSFGHLTGATLPNSQSVNYELDGLGRRVARQANNGAWTGFIWQDDTHLIGTIDASGNVTAQFVYASKDNVPDEALIGGVKYLLISDERGSVKMVVNAATGVVAEELSYDEWGNVQVDSAPGLQPFGFAGGVYDPVTGFTHFGAMDLDPTTGRWTSRDPILFGGGQANLYVYAGNDPVNSIDTSGNASVTNNLSYPIQAAGNPGPGQGTGSQLVFTIQPGQTVNTLNPVYIIPYKPITDVDFVNPQQGGTVDCSGPKSPNKIDGNDVFPHYNIDSNGQGGPNVNISIPTTIKNVYQNGGLGGLH